MQIYQTTQNALTDVLTYLCSDLNHVKSITRPKSNLTLGVSVSFDDELRTELSSMNGPFGQWGFVFGYKTNNLDTLTLTGLSNVPIIDDKVLTHMNTQVIPKINQRLGELPLLELNAPNYIARVPLYELVRQFHDKIAIEK